MTGFLDSFFGMPVLRRVSETDQGPHRSATPESTHMQNIQLISEAQDALSFIREGFVVFTPDKASEVLRHCAYDRQRPIDKWHVETLRELMARGSWTPKDKIDFADFDGRLILVNGYHRMTAQATSGRAIEWTVAIHRCASMEEVRSLYFSFDTNVRIRTQENIIQGVGFAEQHGLASAYARALYRAAPIIAAGMWVGGAKQSGSKELLKVQRIVDARIEFATQFVDQAKIIQELIKPADSQVKTKMKSGGFFAVALATIKHAPERGIEFWGGLFLNDRLRRGDPRATLHADMLTRDYKQGMAQQSVVIPTVAWNAFYECRDLKIIKVVQGRSTPLRGTPFTVKT